MVIKWKGYPVKKGTRATTAVQSSKSTLKAINDIYILEEEAPKPEVDKPSGFTKDVVDMVTSGKLIIPDTAQYYLNKYPCIGTVLAHGDTTRYNIPIGTRVLFARYGVQRDQIDGKDYVFVREADLHATLD